MPGRLGRPALILGLGMVFAVMPSWAFAGDSGWTWMNPLPQGNRLNNVWCASAMEFFAVGENGAIVHYNGTSFSVMDSGTTDSLYDVWGTSATDVYAASSRGRILHYDGAAWTVKSKEVLLSPNRFWFASAMDVFAVGAYGRIWHYDGADWSEMTSNTHEHLNSIWGASPKDVFAVGNRGAILHYDGTDWTVMNSGTTWYLRGVWGSSPTDVYAVGGNGTILHYDGTAWTAMGGMTTSTLNAIWGRSGTDLYAVGDFSTILHYDGTSWSVMIRDPRRKLMDIRGSAARDIFAVGEFGTILYYNGAAWSTLSSGLTENLNDAWGASPTDVFAVGSAGTILHYDGTAWTAMSSGTNQDLNSVWGSSARNVLAVGNNGTIMHFNGKVWMEKSSGTERILYGVWGSSAKNVYAVGTGGVILHYDGRDWTVVSSHSREIFYGVWGSSAENIFAVGSSGTILHYDGTAWTAVPSGTTQTLRGVWGTSSSNVYAAGYWGTVLHYDGAGWSTLDSGLRSWLFGVWGSSATDVFAVGGNAIYRYDGAAWTNALAFDSTSIHLHGIWGSSAGDVFVVGWGGAILHYATGGGRLPEIGLSREALSFRYEIGGMRPEGQKVLIRNTGGGVLDWVATPNAGWLKAEPGTGSGDREVLVSVDPKGLAAGRYAARVAITAPGATNSPRMVDVTMDIIAAVTPGSIFGSFDTPTDGARVHGEIPITGWALGDVEVLQVDIKRLPLSGEDPALTGSDGLIHVGPAAFVEGARPDVESACPDHPLNRRAGWGYMLMSSMLPHGGDGPMTLYAFAVDTCGTRVELGRKTVIVDNANSKFPFGTMDSPEPHGAVSGEDSWNIGWALTPQPNMIPTDGSTIHVWVDGVMRGNPSYHQRREDIAEMFPGCANSNGAGGVFRLDATAYEKGVHTIAWGVVDNAGNAAGIGPRFFSVWDPADSITDRSETPGDHVLGGYLNRAALDDLPTDRAFPIYAVRGFNPNSPLEIITPGLDGVADIEISEVGKLELILGPEAMERAEQSGRWTGRGTALPWDGPSPENSGRYTFKGYLVVGDELRPLPIGSTLDRNACVFAWQPGPGFLGEFVFVFVRERRGGLQDKIFVRITIRPKF